MTEYAEEYDDEYADHTAREQIEELQAQVEEQQEVAEINRQIAVLQAEHGSRFTPAEVDAIGTLIDEGHDPVDAYEHVAPVTAEEQDAEHEFAANVEQLERTEGRALSEAEQQRVWESVLDDTEEVELHNLDNPQGRRQWAAERYAETFEQEEVPEVVELPDDASADERREYMTARMDGAEVSSWPYQSPTSEPGGEYE